MPHNRQAMQNMLSYKGFRAGGSIEVAIYYLDANIIGRSSGRSAVGASAYRRSEKLQSVAATAYHRGELIIQEGDKVIHDYTRKTGVIHSEIILPKDVPPEFRDPQILWNAVENRETHKAARLARELSLEEHLEVLRAFVWENFVSRGLAVDFSIHDKGDGNPHAHIMVTTRVITSKGLEGKDRFLDKKSALLVWRKSWADINKLNFEEKGLDERIDHRSYKARGIDREPTKHLGKDAWALEKKGVKTEKGNYNREVQKRNAEREAAKSAQTKTKEKETLQEGKDKADVALGPEPSIPKEAVDNEEKSAVTKLSALKEHYVAEENYVGAWSSNLKNEKTTELGRDEKDALLVKELVSIRNVTSSKAFREKLLSAIFKEPYVSDLEKRLKAEQAIRHIEKAQVHTAPKIAKHLNTLQEKYLVLEKEQNTLLTEYNREQQEIPLLDYRIECLDEHVENMETLRGRVAQLQQHRQGLSFLEIRKKKEADREMGQAVGRLERAQGFFRGRFGVDASQAVQERARLQAEIVAKRALMEAKGIRMDEIRKMQDEILLDYHTEKLRVQARPDKEQIEKLAEQTRTLPKSTRDKLLLRGVECRLNTITDKDFKRVVGTLQPYEAKILTDIRQKAKVQELAKALERERTQTRGRER
jgi:hypothetical protein